MLATKQMQRFVMCNRWIRLLALLLSPMLGGCFDIEQGVKLNEDYSGTATFNVTVDMEPMVVIMAAMEKAFSGDESPPTKEEVESARANFLAQREEDEQMNFQREEAEENLPEGVRLVSFQPVDEGMHFGARMEFEFDHVDRLRDIDFHQALDAEEEPGPGKPEMIEQPFAGLVFSDEGDTMLVTSAVENPMSDLRQEDPSAEQDMGEWEEVLTRSFESLRVATRLSLPFEVIEHNATRVDGDTLWWEYDLKTLESLTPEELSDGIRVRFKK